MAGSNAPAPLVGRGRKEMGRMAEVMALSSLETVNSFETFYTAHTHVKFFLQFQGGSWTP